MENVWLLMNANVTVGVTGLTQKHSTSKQLGCSQAPDPVLSVIMESCEDNW